MAQSLAKILFPLLVFISCIRSIVSMDVALFSERENQCGGSWLPYKDEKCVKVITRAKYDKTNGVSLCRSYSQEFDTSYSLLRIQNEDEQTFFSQLLFKEMGINENVWLEYKVMENKLFVLAENDHSSLINLPVYFNNWPKTHQSDKNGRCVQMLHGNNETEAGLWDTVNCKELNIVVCERPQPVTMESLQVKHYQLESMMRILFKRQNIIKETVKEVHKVPKDESVQQTSTSHSVFTENSTDGNTSTKQPKTYEISKMPWDKSDQHNTSYRGAFTKNETDGDTSTKQPKPDEARDISKDKPNQQNITSRGPFTENITYGNTTTKQPKTYEIRNIAKGMPVKQSSTYRGAVAEYAIDGDTNTMQHTDVGDRFPWWRIDLKQSYNVRKVSIFSRPIFEKRFHDVSIVVSDIDISTTPKGTVFNPSEKSVCANNIGSDYVVKSKWTTFDCKQRVMGRYVSIQITADCKPTRKDCISSRDTSDSNYFQLLQMMEVQVFVAMPKS